MVADFHLPACRSNTPWRATSRNGWCRKRVANLAYWLKSAVKLPAPVCPLRPESRQSRHECGFQSRILGGRLGEPSGTSARPPTPEIWISNVRTWAHNRRGSRPSVPRCSARMGPWECVGVAHQANLHQHPCHRCLSHEVSRISLSLGLDVHEPTYRKLRTNRKCAHGCFGREQWVD